jgi:hypothetical protein
MVLLLVHAAATLMMFGVILVVQWVHYPLFRHVGTAAYTTYHAGHMRRITGIVAPLMGTELVTAGLLVWVPPPGVPAWQPWAGLALVSTIWASTGLVQVPLHRALAEGFDPSLHRRLVRTNWIRTGAWAARAALVLCMLRGSL